MVDRQSSIQLLVIQKKGSSDLEMNNQYSTFYLQYYL